MIPPQPIPKDVSSDGSKVEYKFVLDGVSGIGNTWNIVSIQSSGNTIVELDEQVYASSPEKYKGIPELLEFKRILRVKLGVTNSFGPVDLLLLLCTRENNRYLKYQLYNIRKQIVQAMRRSILKLPDASITKRDNEYRINEDFTIHDHEDWEQLGDILREEILNIHNNLDPNERDKPDESEEPKELEKPDESEEPEERDKPDESEEPEERDKPDESEELDERDRPDEYEEPDNRYDRYPKHDEKKEEQDDKKKKEQDEKKTFWENISVYFLIQKLGDEYMIEPSRYRIIYRNELNKFYSHIRIENVIRFVFHCGMDYEPTTEIAENYMIVPNSEYLSLCLPSKNRDYYCPFLAIPGLGNSRYTFPKQEDNTFQGNVSGCQIYQRWTNYMKYHPYQFFREPFIAQRLSAITNFRFDFKLERYKEKFQKVRKYKDKEILEDSIAQLIKGMLLILEAGVEARVEVFHSSKPAKDKTFGEVLETAHKETQEWLTKKKMAWVFHKKMFVFLEKSAVMEWAKYFIIPSLNTLEKIMQKTKQATNAENVLLILKESFWSTQDYMDAMAAETVITFLLQGRLHETSNSPYKWNKNGALEFFGFNIQNVNGLSSLKNIEIDDNNFLHCNNGSTLFQPPEWITRPEISFLRDIIAAIDSFKFKDPNVNDVEKLLSRSLIGYAIAFEEKVDDKDWNIEYSKDELDFNTIIPRSSGIRRPRQQGQTEIKRSVKALPDFVDTLLVTSEIGKKHVPYVLNLVDSHLKKDNQNWNIKTNLVNFLKHDILRRKNPIPVVLSWVGGSFIAGIPYGEEDYPFQEYGPLLESTFKWLLGISPSYYKLTEKERKDFQKFEQLFNVFSSKLRSKVDINDLMSMLVFIREGKIEEARQIVKKIEELFNDEPNKNCLMFLHKLI